MAFSTGTMVVYTFGVFAKPLASELKTSRGSLALAVSILDIMVAIGAPGAGLLVDRYGARGVIVASLGGLSGGLVALCFVPRSSNAVAFLRDFRLGWVDRSGYDSRDLLACRGQLV
jgi:MFS family permease